jgi:hypothetical protein
LVVFRQGNRQDLTRATATFFAQAEEAAGADLAQLFVKDDFDAFLECGILAHGFLRLRPRQAAGLQLQAPRILPLATVPLRPMASKK